jgi:hypothetical protein
MKVFAFAHKAPDEVLLKLRGEGIERSDVYIVGDNEIIDRKTKRTHFIFMSVHSFQRNREGLELRKVQSYVCDDPIALSQFSFTPADYRAEEFFHIDGFALTPCIRLDKCPDVPIVRLPFDVVKKAKDHAKQQATFLMQFMTFVYLTPSETHQKPIKELVCKWMASKESFSQYCKRVEKLRQTVPLTDKQVKRMNDLLSSPTAILYREALQMEGEEDDIAKQLKISAYELRYIRAINKGVVVKGMKKPKAKK